MREYDEKTGLYYEIKEAGDRKYAVITDADRKLKEAAVPDTLGGWPVEAVGRKAFLGCKRLRKVLLPETVNMVGEWAFAFCDSLTCVCLPRRAVELGKGVFKNDKKLRDILLYEADKTGGDDPAEVCDPGTLGNERESRAVAELLAAAPIYMDAGYLLDILQAGSVEWYNKWDTRLMHILSLKDDEGYHLYVLCGEEDLHFDYDQYLEYNREKKAYLCMLRLYNDVYLQDDIRNVLTGYLLDHTIGSGSDAAIRVLLRDHAEDREYYELMIREGVITPSNLEAVLLKMGDRHPQMKAFLMETVRTDTGNGTDSFFDGLAL